MVRFEDTLEKAMRLKWKPYYINYRVLKERLSEVVSEKVYGNHEFIGSLRSQCVKAIRFYELTETRLKMEGAYMLRNVTSEENRDKALKEWEAEVEALRHFASLNLEGARKIAKKYDKMCGTTKSLQADIVATMRNSKIATANERLHQMGISLVDANAARLQCSDEKEATEPPSPKQPLLRSRLKSVDAGMEALTTLLDTHEWPPVAKRQEDLKLKKSYFWRFRRFVLRGKLNMPALFLIGTTILCFWNPSPELNVASYFSIFITMQSLHFLLNQGPPDVILLCATLMLRLFGVITDGEAWGGFSNEVVLSVAVLGIVSAGVHHTGVVEFLLLRILGRPKRFSVALLRLCMPAYALNVCISNTCVMGVLIPVIEKWSKEIGIHSAMFLMPMSYLMLISGTFAIFSTSSNLITQSLLVARGLEPFHSFEIAKLCCVCTIAATAYVALTIPWLMSRYSHCVEEVESISIHQTSRRAKSFVCNVQVSGASLDDSPISECGLVPSDIVRLERMGTAISEIRSDTRLNQYDVIYICTNLDVISRLAKHVGISFMALDAGWEFKHTSSSRAIVEVVLDGLCPLINAKLIKTTKIETTYGGNCLGIRSVTLQHYTDEERKSAAVLDFVNSFRAPQEENAHKFHIGDNLLLDVPRNFLENYRDSPHFASVSVVDVSEREDDAEGEDCDAMSRKSQAMFTSGLILVVMISCVATDTVSLLQASLLATFALVLTGCLPQQEAFNAIKIRTILTIVGAFGIGKALGKTNVAKVVAMSMCKVLMPFGKRGIYAAVFAATVGLGAVFHATAVVILMFPVCEEMSHASELPLHPTLAMLMIGAGCQMLSPVSYQTNLMAFASGYYTFGDFPKVGIGMVIVIGVVSVCFVEVLV